MPAFATHYIFFEEMKDKIESELGYTLNDKVIRFAKVAVGQA